MEQRSESKNELGRHNRCNIFLVAIGLDNFLIGPTRFEFCASIFSPLTIL